MNKEAIQNKYKIGSDFNLDPEREIKARLKELREEALLIASGFQEGDIQDLSAKRDALEEELKTWLEGEK